MLTQCGFVLALLVQWSVAGYVGGAFTRPASISVEHAQTGTQMRFESVGFESRSWQTPLYYGVRGGYMLRSRVHLEAEFVHLKAYAILPAPAGLILPQFNMSHGANLVLGNVVLEQPLGLQNRLRLTARAGAGLTVPHPEVRIVNTGIERYEASGPAFQLAGGGEFHLGGGFHWLGEYKFTYGKFRVGDPAAGAETGLHTQHLVTGLAYRFR